MVEKEEHMVGSRGRPPTGDDQELKIDPDVTPGAAPFKGLDVETGRVDEKDAGVQSQLDERMNAEGGGEEKERWNSSTESIFRFVAVNTSFLIMGMNDACVGALLPYIETYYDLNYTTVATLFIVPFLGYLIAAFLNSHIHYHLGQRGVAFLGPLSRLIGYIPLALHPPVYPILPILFVFTGVGNGLEDAAWNASVGAMPNANELLGILHGAYGLGATIAPLVATAMVAKAGLRWWTFFYIMIGLSGCQIVVSTLAFRNATGAVYRRKLNYETTAAAAAGGSGQARVTTRTVLKGPIPWLVALFLFGYVGAEVSLGGWIVTFMLRVRHAEAFLAGLTVTLFWLGLTIGRVVLGFITGRIGEKLAITIYLLFSVVLELLYWLVPNFIAAVIFVVLLGFFLGPLFPAVVVVATRLLPKEEHVSAIGFAAAFGGGGAAVFPFAVGAIAQQRGVQVLQPFVLAMFAFIFIVWVTLPGGLSKGGLDKAKEERTKPGQDLIRLFKKMKR